MNNVKPDNQMEDTRTEWVGSAYAKINLGLQLIQRLPTGYHEILTGYCFIDWSDRITVSLADRLELTLSDNSIPADESNLIIQAINHMRRYVRLENNYYIQVDKRIPAGAGLGGGSSNAAQILRMLNKIERLGFSDRDLAELCAGLGADVPLFLQGGPSIGSGIGTTLQPADIQPDCWILTVFPDIECDTGEIYRASEPGVTAGYDLQQVLLQEEPEEWPYQLFNDLEPAAIQQHEYIGNLKDQLYEFGAVYASMSGSGSSVYGLFQQEMAALEAYHALLDHDLKVNLTPPRFDPDFGIYIREREM